MELGLNGRVALITGGSKGIGKAIGRALAAEGVDLMLLARGKEQLEKAADEISTEFGVRVSTVAADITSADSVKAAAEAARAPVPHRSHRRQQCRRPDPAHGSPDHLARLGLGGRRQPEDDGDAAGDSGVPAADAEGRQRPHHQHQRRRRHQRLGAGADARPEQLGDEPCDELSRAGSGGGQDHRQRGVARDWSAPKRAKCGPRTWRSSRARPRPSSSPSSASGWGFCRDGGPRWTKSPARSSIWRPTGRGISPARGCSSTAASASTPARPKSTNSSVHRARLRCGQSPRSPRKSRDQGQLAGRAGGGALIASRAVPLGSCAAENGM